MKKVTLSVAARAYSDGRAVFFASGEGVQAEAGSCSVKKAREKLTRIARILRTEGFYLRE